MCAKQKVYRSDCAGGRAAGRRPVLNCDQTSAHATAKGRSPDGERVTGNLEQMEVRVVEDYSAEDRSLLAGGHSDPSQTGSFGLTWEPKTLHVLIVASGVTVAHAGLLERTVTVHDKGKDTLVRVAGIGVGASLKDRGASRPLRRAGSECQRATRAGESGARCPGRTRRPAPR